VQIYEPTRVLLSNVGCLFYQQPNLEIQLSVSQDICLANAHYNFLTKLLPEDAWLPYIADVTG